MVCETHPDEDAPPKDGAPDTEADSDLARPDGLSDSLLEEALRIVCTIAKNGDPYSEDPARRGKPENHPDTVKALCIVATQLVEQPVSQERTFSPTGSVEARRTSSLDDYLREIERREILHALEAAKQNKTHAARILGITFRALRYKLTQLGID